MASAKELGISPEEFQDAVNLEKLYTLVNKVSGRCAKCRDSPIHYVDCNNYQFLCHSCGNGKDHCKRIGDDRFKSFEMEKLERKYGGGRSGASSTSGNIKRSHTDKSRRSRRKSKQRRRSPSPSPSQSSSESESEDDRRRRRKGRSHQASRRRSHGADGSPSSAWDRPAASGFAVGGFADFDRQQNDAFSMGSTGGMNAGMAGMAGMSGMAGMTGMAGMNGMGMRMPGSSPYMQQGFGGAFATSPGLMRAPGLPNMMQQQPMGMPSGVRQMGMSNAMSQPRPLMGANTNPFSSTPIPSSYTFASQGMQRPMMGGGMSGMGMGGMNGMGSAQSVMQSTNPFLSTGGGPPFGTASGQMTAFYPMSRPIGGLGFGSQQQRPLGNMDVTGMSMPGGMGMGHMSQMGQMRPTGMMDASGFGQFSGQQSLGGYNRPLPSANLFQSTPAGAVEKEWWDV